MEYFDQSNVKNQYNGKNNNINEITQFEEGFNFANNEKEIIEYWKTNETYKKLMGKLSDGTIFRFMDGPPFVSSNKLHYGHILVSFIKDSINRWMRSHGYNVLNKNGKDTHGLPIEQVVNKLLGISTKEEIEKLGINVYNSKCKQVIEEFSGSWEPIFERIGREMDFTDEYKTKDTNFMESVWWAFKELWKKDLVYKGFKIMPFSTGCCTPLSNSEAGQNYKEVTEMSIYITFPLVHNEYVNLVAWTTTPWTLPSNLALCVNPELTYVKLEETKTCKVYIMAKSAINKIFDIPKKKKKNIELPYKILETFEGKILVGLEYKPMFDYFSENRTFRVLGDSYVTAENGTAIVHQAPGFGEDDCRVCIRDNVLSIEEVGDFCPVDDSGLFTGKIYDYKGRYVKEADIDLISKIKEKGRLVKKELYTHNYPFCYRTETPLIYKATSSFFIAVIKIKEKVIKNNKKIKWCPEHVGSGKFNDWLENTKDWGVSRSRFFGTPLPIWASYDFEEMICIGSIQELVKLAGLNQVPTDIHREFVDHITIPSKMGKGDLKRVGGVFDCWFESGCVPYGQIHYPFKNKELLDDNDFLSDFVCEGIDQTRGWFYTLNILSTALFDKPAFKTVICSGLVNGEDGRKMSKRLGNFVDPNIALNKYGADSVRLYLISSPASHAESFKFNGENIKNISGKLFKWYNGVKFFIEHFIKFTKDNHKFELNAYQKTTNVMDKWIISRIGTMVSRNEESMKDYKINHVMNEIFEFIEDLINWYIKFNRNRLKGRNCSNNEQNCALSTLYHVLISSSKVCAPFIPYLCETFYKKLKVILPIKHQELSVHHCSYPKKQEFETNNIVEIRMKRLQTVASLVRSMRSKTKYAQSVKVPLNSVTIAHDDSEYLSDIKKFEQYLTEEINTLEIIYQDQNGLVNYFAKPNAKNIGVKYRALSKQIKKSIMDIEANVLRDYKYGIIKKLEVNIGNEILLLDQEDVSIDVELSVNLSDTKMGLIHNGVIVIIDSNYNDLIKEQHMKRLFTTYVQKLRKNSIIRPWNKINIYYETYDEKFIGIINKYYDEIKEQLLYDIYHKDEYGGEEIIIEGQFDICGLYIGITLSDPTGELYAVKTD